MIPLNPATDTAMHAPVYYPVVLVEMDFDSGVVYAHSGVGDFPWNGHTFKGVSWLGKISDMEEGENLQSYGISLQLSGVADEIVALSLTEHYRGRALKIWLAFLDENSQLEGDPVGPWRWRMSTMDGEFTGSKAIVTLTATSRMAQWERANPLRYTNEEQLALYPGDFYGEFVSAASEKQIEF